MVRYIFLNQLIFILGHEFFVPQYSIKQDRVLFEALKIINTLKIQLNLSEYGLVEYGQRLQEWLNGEYGPSTFQLMCYGVKDLSKPIWSSKVDGDAARPLCIFYSDVKKEFYYERKLAKSTAKAVGNKKTKPQ